MGFYDGTKLLSLMDINGKKPEIYICTTNRSGGKTTYFSRYLVNRFKKYGEKFCLLYRYNYELDDIVDKFFKDIKTLFFPADELTGKKKAKGIYWELFLNDNSCGYAVALNNADVIKKYSHLFSDTSVMMMDEFQSETNHYCNNEIDKFMSIHTSIARGQGKQVRRVPVIMIGNAVTLLNPYYAQMGISERLRDNTKFLRGDGYVLEQGYIDTASIAQKDSGFNRAFGKAKYSTYASQNVYLNDSKSFVEILTGQSKYLATIKYNNNNFAIREFSELGIIYCDDNADKTFPFKIAIDTADHNINYVMLKQNDFFISSLRYFFDHGCFRFKNLLCKEAILKCLSY